MRAVSVIDPFKHLLISEDAHRTTIECGDLASAIVNGVEQEARAAWSADDINRFASSDKSAQWDAANQQWRTVDDYRGRRYWTATEGLTEITEVGVAPPAGAAELTAGQALIRDGQTWRLRTSADDLAVAQQAKIEALEAKAAAKINSGFESSALGAKHKYDSEQHNIDWIQAAVLSAAAAKITCDDGKGAATSKAPRQHTAAQCKTVLTDGMAVLLNHKTKFRRLRDQVNAATDVAAVEAIKW